MILVRGNFISAFGIAGASGVGLKSGWDGKAGDCVFSAWPDEVTSSAAASSAIERDGNIVVAPSERWREAGARLVPVGRMLRRLAPGVEVGPGLSKLSLPDRHTGVAD